VNLGFIKDKIFADKLLEVDEMNLLINHVNPQRSTGAEKPS
jgi:hypothetical protein